MELRALNASQVREIYALYMKADFPEDELRPLEEFLDRMEREIYDCLGLYEDGRLRAYGYFVKQEARGYLLLDFLAVCPEVRSGGYGSRFLQMIREYYREKNGVLLECEAVRTSPNEEQREVRERRIRFYQKNGCKKTDVASRVFGVEFEILYLPLKEADPRLDTELEELYRLMFGEENCRKYTNLL